MSDLDDFLKLAQERFKLCEEAEHDQRIDALDDLQFRANDNGCQWPAKIRADRDRDARPCLTINVLPARERQILNDQRQNRPAIHVNPVDDKADPETADILSGIIRHIWYDSNGDVAIDTGFAAAVRGGFGYVRLNLEYESPTSFDQVIKIKRIRNAFSVYMDPNCQEPDYSDAKYGFIVSNLTKEEFKAEFPKADLTGLDDWQSIGDTAPGWIQDKGVRIAEYFYVESKKVNVCLYSDGTSGVEGEYQPAKGAEKVDERESEVPTVKWAKINAIEKLDETDWLGDWIPIIPILGDELEVDGKRILEGMVRHTKDAVRMNNYMASGIVQAIGIAPLAPWIAAAGQIEDYKEEWKTANTRLRAVLRYNPVDVGGKLVPEPHRDIAEPPIQSMSEARLQFAEDIKSITGIEDAQLGRRSNEISGVAVATRRQQGEMSNFHYVDNLTRSIRHIGRQMIGLIPKVYSKARVMRIIGEDGEQDTVQINGHLLPPDKQQGLENVYNLTVGKYDVTVASGPSFQTKRQEAAASMTDMVKAFPALAATSMDLLAKNLDWPGAKELAERQKRAIGMTMPGLIDEEGQEPIPPQAQQAIAQGQQQVQQLHAYAQQVEKERDDYKQKLDAKVVDNQARMEIERMKIEAQITIAEIGAKSQEAQTRLKMEQDMWMELHGGAHDLGLQKDQQAHEQGMADKQAEIAASQADQSHSQTLEQQQQAADLEPQASGNGAGGRGKLTATSAPPEDEDES